MHCHVPIVCAIALVILGSSSAALRFGRDKIYLGREIEPHSRPWLGWIRIGSKRVKCGCALITPIQVLTAASCVQQPIVSITFGDHNRSMVEGTEQEFTVKSVTQHPDFVLDHRTFQSDLAIIELDRAADTSGPEVSTISLLPSDQLTERIYMKHTRVAGWGHEVLTGGNTITDQSIVPLEYTADVANTTVCNELGVASDSICFEPFRDPDQATCEGDVGGPLVIKRKRVWHLAAVISGYENLDGCSTTKKAAIKITEYITWFNTVLKIGKVAPGV